MNPPRPIHHSGTLYKVIHIKDMSSEEEHHLAEIKYLAVNVPVVKQHAT